MSAVPHHSRTSLRYTTVSTTTPLSQPSPPQHFKPYHPTLIPLSLTPLPFYLPTPLSDNSPSHHYQSYHISPHHPLSAIPHHSPTSPSAIPHHSPHTTVSQYHINLPTPLSALSPYNITNHVPVGTTSLIPLPAHYVHHSLNSLSSSPITQLVALPHHTTVVLTKQDHSQDPHHLINSLLPHHWKIVRQARKNVK